MSVGVNVDVWFARTCGKHEEREDMMTRFILASEEISGSCYDGFISFSNFGQ